MAAPLGVGVGVGQNRDEQVFGRLPSASRATAMSALRDKSVFAVLSEKESAAGVHIPPYSAALNPPKLITGRLKSASRQLLVAPLPLEQAVVSTVNVTTQGVCFFFLGKSFDNNFS